MEKGWSHTSRLSLTVLNTHEHYTSWKHADNSREETEEERQTSRSTNTVDGLQDDAN